MSDGTHIEWTDATVNVVNGCSVVSPGCAKCYAMRLAGTRMRHHPSRQGLTVPSKANSAKSHPVWNGTVRFNDKALLEPLRWKRPRKIFWNAHGDLFHEAVPDEWIDRCFAVMALTPQHIHQVLTKRPERMRAYISDPVSRARVLQAQLDTRTGMSWRTMPMMADNRWPLPNVWLGVSVEDQQRADERIPVLLDIPAAVRWLSMEPLLGPVDLNYVADDGITELNVLTGEHLFSELPQGRKIDWVVLGGESGPGARPMHPDWARSVRDQCAAAGVPFLFKQWGAWLPAGQVGTQTGLWKPTCGSPLLTTKKNAGRLLDGVRHDGYPA